MAAPLTRIYAEFAAGMVHARLSPAQLDVVRLGFTDCAGVLLAALDQAMVQRLATYARKQGGAAQARVLFGAGRVSMAQAGLINATAAHAHDYDDFAFSNHPSAVLVPTILAAADASGADGRRMAAAYVAGYEIWADMMLREVDHYYGKGWHPTAVLGPVGAAAAASVVLGLDATQTRHALALACSIAGGVFENFGTMAKPYHGGRAAEAGLTAAGLAAEGIEASPTAIEGRAGLLQALSPAGKVDLTTPPRIGKVWHIEKERLNIKKYPTVGASQRIIDGVLGLTRTARIEPARIVRIVPRVSEHHLAVMPFHRPETGLQAKFSIEFAVACALLHDAVGLKHLADDVVRAPAMQALMAKVQPETTTEFAPDWPNAAPFDIVHLTMNDGRTISTSEVRRASGHGDTPLSTIELRAKFDACADYAHVPAGQAAKLFEAMQRIDTHASAAAIPAIAR